MILEQENGCYLNLPLSSHLKHVFFGKHLTAPILMTEKTVVYSAGNDHAKTLDIRTINLMN